MKAKDLMTRNVISIARDATVLEAARLMLQHHISGLPVVDASGKLVGVLSEGDLLRRAESSRRAVLLGLFETRGPGAFLTFGILLHVFHGDAAQFRTARFFGIPGHSNPADFRDRT